MSATNSRNYSNPALLSIPNPIRSLENGTSVGLSAISVDVVEAPVFFHDLSYTRNLTAEKYQYVTSLIGAGHHHTAGRTMDTLTTSKEGSRHIYSAFTATLQYLSYISPLFKRLRHMSAVLLNLLHSSIETSVGVHPLMLGVLDVVLYLSLSRFVIVYSNLRESQQCSLLLPLMEFKPILPP